MESHCNQASHFIEMGGKEEEYNLFVNDPSSSPYPLGVFLPRLDTYIFKSGKSIRCSKKQSN